MRRAQTVVRIPFPIPNTTPPSNSITKADFSPQRSGGTGGSGSGGTGGSGSGGTGGSGSGGTGGSGSGGTGGSGSGKTRTDVMETLS
ncbi:hypothetical protein RvY_04121 [Ramazzottius varieornatus]|uniref:Uncharacterized protein n=1 Tax=Ramazzottius varieornatus TaxID=947166 RepID=A0A1D1UQG8_RAMVA|nr:hypothetical protein RvY_04121 [Ramazzottius varieornatus]